MSFILYITGVSASGKSTIGTLLSQRTGLPFFDGDDFHPPENIAKMQSGQPLTDQDRMGWLQAINEKAREEVQKRGAIIACSALKRKYRIVLQAGLGDACKWVLLKGDFEILLARSSQRTGHFMPASLLQSQFDTLEEPEEALVVSVANEPEEIVEEVLAYLNNENENEN